MVHVHALLEHRAVLLDRVRGDVAPRVLVAQRGLDPLFHKIATRYTIHGHDHDDNVQLCRIAAWEAIRSHDPACNVPLAAWVAIVADRRLKDAMSRANREKRGGTDPARDLSINGIVPGSTGILFEDILPATDDPARDVAARADLADLLAYLRSRGPLMRTAGLLFLIGCTYEEISQVTGGNAKQIDNALARVRRAVRDAA